MGTNYYHRRKKCPTCGHTDDGLHIGKSSHGWCFALHVYPDGLGPRNLDEWKVVWEDADKEIVDECGKTITSADMLAFITQRSFTGSNDGFDYAKNYAEPGPNGLVRSKVEVDCIGHGDGTYDLIVGDFS